MGLSMKNGKKRKEEPQQGHYARCPNCQRNFWQETKANYCKRCRPIVKRATALNRAAVLKWKARGKDEIASLTDDQKQHLRGM